MNEEIGVVVDIYRIFEYIYVYFLRNADLDAKLA
ncbi:hypothetical protein DSUL_60221 [Desulfovibrionales bacterium]